MGRYYFGTISGKFWVCVQTSDDASYYKSPIIFSGPLKCYEYMGCCCIVKDMYDLYCKECYNSLEEQVDSLEDEDNISSYKENDTLIYENNYIKYNFESIELKYIQNQLKKLEKIINIDTNLLNITFKNKINNEQLEGNYEYYINYDSIKDLDDNQCELIARWCLGKQIEHCIIQLGHCKMVCEV